MTNASIAESRPDDIDDFVDAWHEGDGRDETLARYLGFDKNDYALWAT